MVCMNPLSVPDLPPAARRVTGPDDADRPVAVAREPISESNTPALRQPLSCLRCGHVTPFVEGWMMSAAMHHIAAVHGRKAASLRGH